MSPFFPIAIFRERVEEGSGHASGGNHGLAVTVAFSQSLREKNGPAALFHLLHCRPEW
jgi:hypothetical protein